MAGEVLNSWGINDCQAIGNIVFNMVDNQLLGKSDDDSIQDFNHGFDFKEAFSQPFQVDADSPDNPPIIA